MGVSENRGPQNEVPSFSETPISHEKDRQPGSQYDTRKVWAFLGRQGLNLHVPVYAL